MKKHKSMMVVIDRVMYGFRPFWRFIHLNSYFNKTVNNFDYF